MSQGMTSAAEALYQQNLSEVRVATDQGFGFLLVLQWVFAIFIAIAFSPLAWSGRQSYVHPHVLFAIVFGAIITLPPLFLILKNPGAAITRHLVAACQMLHSGLLIHLTGGRIETHFHVFGSLAFLSFYRDAGVLYTASTVTAVDHFVRGYLLPQSIFGVPFANPLRALEHTGWVIFEDIFLIIGGKKQLQEMQTIATQMDEIQQKTTRIEALADQRTQQLQISENRYEILCRTLPVGIFHINDRGEGIYANEKWQEIYSMTLDQARDGQWLERIHPADRDDVLQAWQTFMQGGDSLEQTYRMSTPRLRWVRAQIVRVPGITGEGDNFVGALEDIDERVQSEQRLKMQFAVSQMLAQSQASAETIMPEILQGMSQAADWQAARFWLQETVAGQARLRCTALYDNASVGGHDLADLDRDRAMVFSPPIKPPSADSGIHAALSPIDAWHDKRVIVIDNIVAQLAVDRSAVAINDGIKSGGAFPILVDGQVYGVIEFFAHETRLMDERTRTVLASLGTEIGLSIERRRAERLLKASEDRFSRVLDLSLDAFVMADGEGNITHWSHQAEELVGCTANAALGRKVHDMLVPDRYKTQFDSLFADMRKDVEGVGINFRKRMEGPVKGRDQTELPAEITIVANQFDEHFEVAAFLRDVSKEREHEKVTKLLAQIVQSTSDAIIGRDTRGIIQSWNNGAEKMFGYNAQEAIGKSYVDLLVPARLKSHIDEVERQVMSGQVVSDLETERLNKDGSTVDVALTASALKNEFGEVEGVSLIYRDIRQRKELERRMSEFYSIVSHELRTPLTSIRGALGLIMDGIIEIDSDESKEMIGVALSSSERLGRLINDILDIKKIEAGKLDLRIEAIESSVLISNAVAVMDGMARQAEVSIMTDVDESYQVKADMDRITQVLTNLISNAIKYSAPGGAINVSCELCHGRLRFMVTDEGTGIAQEYMGLLFNKFQQIDSSDTRAKEGTGLGLALCKAIVEEHGGTIGVHSKLGAGSTFWFELPLVQSVDEICEHLASNGATKQILIVEDDDNLAQMLRLLLRKSGFSSLRAANKKEAMAAIDAGLPKVVLLDLNLPDGSGIEVLDHLRLKSGDDKAPPVIVMTGQEEIDKANLPYPLILGCFFKPLNLVQLLDTIKQTVNINTVKTVLLVEDDPNTSRVVSAQIRSLGAACIEARNGLQALALTDELHPDLIVLDVGLPKLNGFEVIEVLKKGPYSHVPLLVYSGRELEKTEKQKLTLGLTTYLNKGRVSPSEFVSSVQFLLKKVEEGNKQQ